MNRIVKRISHFVLPQRIERELRISYSRFLNKDLLKQTHLHYADVVKSIRQRNQNEKIRFGMYVVYDSSFGGYELAEILKEHSDKFSLKFVIVPDSSRGDEQLKIAYNQTRSFFVKKYGAEYVFDGLVDGEYVDYSSEFDVIYCANPYDSMVPEIFGVQYLSKRNLLPIYIPYCYSTAYTFDNVMPLKELSLFWKIFANTDEDVKMYRKKELLKGRNVELVGYAKMDSLKKINERTRIKKRIIIAPHHTVAMNALQLSNFLTYSDFFLELPELYPEFDFVFRPHPLLFSAMVNANIWTWDDVDSYIKKLEKLGVEYSKGGDYFDLFVNSDAMIHDCGSFLEEYLFLKKPCCYMLRSNSTKRFLTRYGKRCLKMYKTAYNKKDILSFLSGIRNESYNKQTYRGGVQIYRNKNHVQLSLCFKRNLQLHSQAIRVR